MSTEVRDLLRQAVTDVAAHEGLARRAVQRGRGRLRRRRALQSLAAALLLGVSGIAALDGLTGGGTVVQWIDQVTEGVDDPAEGEAVLQEPVPAEEDGGGSLLTHDLDDGVWSDPDQVPLSARTSPAAVWADDQLLVWSGHDAETGERLTDGARLTADGWVPMADSPLPLRQGAATVWTGSALIVWGGVDEGDGADDAGAVYEPEHDRWSPLPPAPVRVQAGVVGAWTGEEALFVGGLEVVEDMEGSTGDPSGAAFDPQAGTWRTLPPAPMDLRSNAQGVWTGDELIIWGGFVDRFVDQESDAPAGAAYDPRTDRWRPIAPAPIAPRVAPLVWTGEEVLVAGGMTHSGTRADAAAYDPARDAWRELAPLPEPRMASVWTGERLLAVGGPGPGRTHQRRSVLSYDPDADAWESWPELPGGAHELQTVTWAPERSRLLTVTAPQGGEEPQAALRVSALEPPTHSAAGEALVGWPFSAESPLTGTRQEGRLQLVGPGVAFDAPVVDGQPVRVVAVRPGSTASQLDAVGLLQSDPATVVRLRGTAEAPEVIETQVADAGVAIEEVCYAGDGSAAAWVEHTQERSTVAVWDLATDDAELQRIEVPEDAGRLNCLNDWTVADQPDGGVRGAIELSGERGYRVPFRRDGAGTLTFDELVPGR